MDAPPASAGGGAAAAGSANVPTIKEYQDMSTDTVVDITVTFHPSYPHTVKQLSETMVDFGCCNKLEKILGLYTTQSTSNMNLFDAHEKLKKYANIYDIIEDYYVERLEMYSKRKAAILAQLSNELRVLSNRAKYIQEILDDKLDMRRKTKDIVFELLKTRGYEHIEGDDEYRYLLKMPMDSVTEENVTKLLAERDTTRIAHTKLYETSIQHLWCKDLDELEQEYRKWADAAEAAAAGSATNAKAPQVKKKLTVKKQ